MIQVVGISKSFGKVTAASNIGFEVETGEVFGLLGPNGAGKTTTLRILATLIRPDGGSATVAGFDVLEQAQDVRRSIGVVNGGMGLYDRLTGGEILAYFGRLYGMDSREIDRRVRELDETLDLGESLMRRAGDFSTGMKQKIVVARAVLHDPPVLFFDEATNGLDVVARRAVLDLVKRFAADGKTVVYSTHAMSEVEELCQRLAIVYRGRIVARDTTAGLLRATGTGTLEGAFFATVEAAFGGVTGEAARAEGVPL